MKSQLETLIFLILASGLYTICNFKVILHTLLDVTEGVENLMNFLQ